MASSETPPKTGRQAPASQNTPASTKFIVREKKNITSMFSPTVVSQSPTLNITTPTFSPQNSISRNPFRDITNVVNTSTENVRGKHIASSSTRKRGNGSRVEPPATKRKVSVDISSRRLDKEFEAVIGNASSSIPQEGTMEFTKRGHYVESIIFQGNKLFKGNPWIKKYNAITNARPPQTVYPEYHDLGDPEYKCLHCSAIFWKEERLGKKKDGSLETNYPVYSKCCMHGKIKLPDVIEPPDEYKRLLYTYTDLTKSFLANHRRYNNVMAFTSLGGQVEITNGPGPGPPCFKIHGENYHRIGGLLPSDSVPKFAQLYIYDTENEVQHRVNAAGKGTRDDGKLDDIVIYKLKNILNGSNRLVGIFRQAGEKVQQNAEQNYHLRLLERQSSDGRKTSSTQASEVAVLIPGDVDRLEKTRDIIVTKHSGSLKRISELHVMYLPLQYPLIYLWGQDGYRKDILHEKTESTKETKDRCTTMLQWVIYYLHERARDSPHLMHSRRLFQQWLVDVFTMVEAFRLLYIRLKQDKLRCATYFVLDDAFSRGDTDVSLVGKRIRLPPSFVGGPRFMIQNYHDAMAICRYQGYPNLFITFTCNSNWPEIARFVNDRGLTKTDRTDIQSRVFHMKLKMLMDDILVHHMFGVDKGAVYTIEYQNRGLPHAHILIWLENCTENVNTSFIDTHISAELPDKESDPVYYDAVNEFMIHGPCGEANKAMACTVNGVCTRHFPKRHSEETTVDQDGYVVYRRRKDGRTVPRKEINLDNRFVVPHNRKLLLKYHAHINVEYCNRSRSIKYLFKYVHKGNDHATVAFYKASDNGEPVDEVKLFVDARYVSASEASWRLHSFETHFRRPSVLRLAFHLEGYQPVIYKDEAEAERLIEKQNEKQTMLTAWFIANQTIQGAKNYTYPEFPMHFVWLPSETKWRKRVGHEIQLGMLYYVYPGQGDLYYLRILLNYVKGCECFADIRTYKGDTFNTFREACLARDLLDDDAEFIRQIEEAAESSGGKRLRTLFCDQLLLCNVSEPEMVFAKTWHLLSDDILLSYRERMRRNDLELTEDQIRNQCLILIVQELNKRNKSLKDWPSMPFPDLSGVDRNVNQLIADERAYDKAVLKNEHENLVMQLNPEQLIAYQTITDAIHKKKKGIYFLYGYGGTGKTFVWKTLSAAIRSEGGIVLNVASSGIASLLLPGGRTTHSRFHIPLDIAENSTCNIEVKGDAAELIKETSLIIWDEAPMVNRHCFEALDKTLRDIMRTVDKKLEDVPFGGKIVIFGGDFRQILPVIPKGTREDIVRATINSSPIWRHVTVLRLTKNMRLQSLSPSSDDAHELINFSEWLTSLGDGTLGGDNDGEAEIEIPDDLLITESTNHIHSIVDATYPDFINNIGNVDYLNGRAILSPTLEDVEKINDYMVSLHDSEEKVYRSADSLSLEDRGNSMIESMQSIEYLNTIKCSGLPNHELKLKVGVPVMLMRNTNPNAGLCNGTRLMITKLGTYVIEGQILGGKNAGDIVWIPRMKLTPTDSRLPFKFDRRQFPLIRSYAMTINKSQGQSLQHVGVHLSRPVFTHGQLYVAISRVTSRNGLKLLICDSEGNLKKTTINVVYKEVFNNV